MSIEAIQMRVAQPTDSSARPNVSASAVSGAAAASGASTENRRFQDQVEVSDQARQLAADLGQPEVELQLSPAKLREMMGRESQAANK